MFETEFAKLECLPPGDPEEERSGIQSSIASQIHASRADSLQWLRSLDREDPGDALTYAEVIESLALSSLPVGDLLEEELRRIRDACAASPSRSMLSALRAFDFMEQSAQLRQKAYALHLEGLSSPAEFVRIGAVRSLHGWQVCDEPGGRESLYRCLSDPSWRVRQEAEWLLRDEGQLPPGYRTSLIDRVRRSLFKKA